MDLPVLGSMSNSTERAFVSGGQTQSSNLLHAFRVSSHSYERICRLSFHCEAGANTADKNTLMPYETDNDSDQRIVPGMSDHSRSNASTPMGQNPEHDSIQTDRQNHPKPLVRVGDSEYGSGEQNPSGSTLCYSYKLPL
jgi:hypothetical protein